MAKAGVCFNEWSFKPIYVGKLFDFIEMIKTDSIRTTVSTITNALNLEHYEFETSGIDTLVNNSYSIVKIWNLLSAPQEQIIEISNKSGFIYFIQSGDKGAIKIGYASSVTNRLKTLQTGNQNKLIVLHQITGTKETEALLHERFKNFRMEGEWFMPVPELLAWIEGNKFTAK